MDSIAAKEFLISKVVEQAELEHVPFSEVEKKMLYFTEVHPTLPDIYEVNAEFERDYDTDQYERKVAGLLRGARDRDRAQSAMEGQQWGDAIDALKNEDHYILVMVHQAFGHSAAPSEHRLRDFLIYIAIAIGVVIVLVWSAFKK